MTTKIDVNAQAQSGTLPVSPEQLPSPGRSVVKTAKPANDTKTKAPPVWPALADLARGLGALGPRLPVGVRPIDDGWRGGATIPLLWVIGGAPGAGKTTFATERALRLAEGGTPVAILAGDEPRDGILVRLGQQLGHRREWLEAGLPNVLEDLATDLAALPLYVLDPESDPAADVGAAAAELRRRHPEGHVVLVADSLQALARRVVLLPGAGDTMKLRVDAVLADAKAAAKKHGMLIIVLSELNRSAYRHKDDSDNVEDLAAGKESGSIEYDAGALMVMRNVKDDGDLVACSFAKSRPGKVAAFFLRLNRDTATMVVEARGTPEPSTSPKARMMDDAKEKVLAYVVANPGHSKTTIRTCVEVPEAKAAAALEALEVSSAIVARPREGKGGGFGYYPV